MSRCIVTDLVGGVVVVGLGVKQVRTHHNTQNLPMIAIDRKLGYVPMPGTFLMEKGGAENTP